MVVDKNIFLFPRTQAGRDALRQELYRRQRMNSDCPVSAINWDGVAQFHREDGEAVARNIRRYTNEQETPNGKTY